MIRRIAMSGGGMKGIAHVGALEVLEKHGRLQAVKEYVGTSAGALMAFCLCIGYSVAELRDLCLRFDFTMMQTLDPDTVLEMPTTFGLDNGQNLEKLLRALLKTKGHAPDLTFEELGPLALRVYAADVQTCLIKEFSAQTTPRVPVRIAVAASMAIPFYFAPVVDPETGHLLVDGGLVAHFPFHHLTAAEREESIGLAFSQDYKIGTDVPTTLVEYCLQLYYSVYHHQNERLISAWSHRIIFLPCGHFPALAFDSGSEQKEELLTAGREGAEEFLKESRQFMRPAPERRHSI